MLGKERLCALILCAGASFTAHAVDATTAADPGFQLGIGAGQSNWSLPDLPGSDDLHAVGFQAFFGYRLFRYVAFEGSYIDGGSLSRSIPVTQGASLSISTRPHLASATALGILPLSQDYSLFARAGADHAWYDTHVAVTGVGSTTVGLRSNEFIWGAGGSMYVDHALLRAEYEQTKVNPGQLRLISISIVWML